MFINTFGDARVCDDNLKKSGTHAGETKTFHLQSHEYKVNFHS